jgi:glycosyltransferase involved in cell wall biosynthesis
MNGLAGLLGRYLRRRQVYLDCDDYEAVINRFGAGWQKQGVVFFERELPRRVDYITTHTFFIRSRLLADGIPPERIFYISNGVDRQRFTAPDPQKLATLRHELGLEGKQVIAYIGSMSLAGHPIDLLLKAFSTIHLELPESVLMLVGGGEDYEKLRFLGQDIGISEAMILRGRVSPDEVGLYYYLSDVSVDPVYDDAVARGRSPLKLFESWACGVPFVSADVGDRRLLLGDPPAGLLTSPGDPASLAETILRILNDADLAQTLRTRGLERVKTYFWDQLAVQLDELYRRLAVIK